MHRLMMTSAIVLAAASFTLPADAQTNSNSAQNEQAAAQNQADMNKLREACQKSWPVVDTDDDTTISRDEAEQATKAEFNRIDADGNGTISAAEWAACAAPNLNDGDVWTANLSDDQFAEMDKDDSGDVSAQEAAEMTKQQYSGSKGDHAVQQGMKSGMSFAALDKNNDRMISQEEWNNREKASVEWKYSTLDQDGNDKVNLSEYAEFRRGRYAQAQQDQAQRGDGQSGEQPTVWVYYYYVL